MPTPARSRSRAPIQADWCSLRALAIVAGAAGCGSEVGAEPTPATFDCPRSQPGSTGTEPALRSAVRELIFPEGQLPAAPPDAVSPDVDNPFVPASTPNLAQIDQFRFDLAYGLSAYVHHFRPTDDNGRLVIHNLGHWQGINDAAPVLSRLLAWGYEVLVVPMPLMGGNTQDVDVRYAGRDIYLGNHHDDLLAIEELGGPTFSLFFEPLARALSAVTAERSFERVAMMGLSGGGWTTDVYSAIDLRIDSSYSIAGSLPFALRTPPNELGCYEQLVDRPLFALVDYRDLYFLSALGRGQRHRQILHENDSCCFKWAGRAEEIRAYALEVQDRLTGQDQGGDFAVELLPELGGHAIYPQDLEFIHAELSRDCAL